MIKITSMYVKLVSKPNPKPKSSPSIISSLKDALLPKT